LAGTLLARREIATDQLPALFRLRPLAWCDLHRTSAPPPPLALDSVNSFIVRPCAISCLARTPPSSSAPARRNPTVTFMASSHNQHPGDHQLITRVGGRPGVPSSRPIPAASARRSSRSAARSRSSAIDSARSKVRLQRQLSDGAVRPAVSRATGRTPQDG